MQRARARISTRSESLNVNLHAVIIFNGTTQAGEERMREREENEELILESSFNLDSIYLELNRKGLPSGNSLTDNDERLGFVSKF